MRRIFAVVEILEDRRLMSGVVTGDGTTDAEVTGQSIVTVKPSRAERASAKASARYLAQVMDQTHEAFWVYRDVSDPANHFHSWGKLPDETADVAMNGSWTASTHSGATAVRATFVPHSQDDFGGFYMMNGVLPEGATVPQFNFGTIANAGVDLSGAKALTFWVKDDSGGGGKVQFFMGGVGRDDPDATFPDSTPTRRPRTLVTALSTRWRQVRINLKGADLSYILGGFGWVASARENPNGVAFLVDDIKFELDGAAQQRRLNEPRFIASYQTLPLQPDPFDGNVDDDIDLVLRNTAFSYDNSLAIIAFLAEGSSDSLRRAELVGDAFVYASEHDRQFTDGRIRTDYAAGDVALPPGWTPGGRIGTVPIPGFYSEDRQQFFEVEQTAVDTGNNAWTMIALLALYRRTGEVSYLNAATRVGAFLRSMRSDTGTYQGFLGGINDPEGDDPTARAYASAEHNLDVMAAFTEMARVTGDEKWTDDARHARQFVASMWDPTAGLYRPGTADSDTVNVNPEQLPLDVQAWSVLATSDVLALHPDLLMTLASTHGVTADGISGFDFNTDRDGVWLEGTGQAAVSYAVAGDLERARALRAELRRAQQTPPTGDRAGLAAASRNGLTTGFSFKYFQRLHIAATAWNVFAQLGFNPYYSGERPPLIAAATPTVPSPTPTPTPFPTPSPTPIPTPIPTPEPTPTPTGPVVIELTHVPTYGSTEDLAGQVRNADPSQYRVVVALKVGGGWWNKPLWDQAALPLDARGAWTCDVTTGELDQFATDIAVFLVPADFGVPVLNDALSLPTELLSAAVAHQDVHRSSATVNGEGTPALQVSNVPPLGSFENLRGVAEHVNPVEYQVAILINVAGGWWSKPTWAHPAVPIAADGSWEADFTTGGYDESATEIVALLVPSGNPLPIVGGAPELPAGINDLAVGRVDVHRP